MDLLDHLERGRVAPFQLSPAVDVHGVLQLLAQGLHFCFFLQTSAVSVFVGKAVTTLVGRLAACDHMLLSFCESMNMQTPTRHHHRLISPTSPCVGFSRFRGSGR